MNASLIARFSCRRKYWEAVLLGSRKTRDWFKPVIGETCPSKVKISCHVSTNAFHVLNMKNWLLSVHWYSILGCIKLVRMFNLDKQLLICFRSVTSRNKRKSITMYMNEAHIWEPWPSTKYENPNKNWSRKTRIKSRAVQIIRDEMSVCLYVCLSKCSELGFYFLSPAQLFNLFLIWQYFPIIYLK